MAIYVNFEKTETLKEFLKKLFSFFSVGLGAITTDRTYLDKELTVIQCYANRRRSFDDLLEIVNTYFPEVTPKELIHELIVFVPENYQDFEPRLGDCSGIERIRITYHRGALKINPFIAEKFKSKYSWRELLNMLDINTYEEYVEYVKKNREVVKLEEVKI